MSEKRNFWKHIIEWLDREKYLFSLITILIGLFFLYHQLSKPRLKNESDLLEITGIVKNYDFSDKESLKRTLHKYYLWLDGYNNTFQIKADYLEFFRGREFKNEVKLGDSISLTIPKEMADKLNRNDIIFILSADANNSNYLDKNETLKDEDSGFDIYVGMSFILAGLGFYIFKRLSTKNHS